MKWYERARALMEERGILVKDIADTLDMTPGGAGHYLSGRRDPSPGMLVKIARRIGVSVSELVEDDPLFARNRFEHDVLEAIRNIPAEQHAVILAMLRGVESARNDEEETRQETSQDEERRQQIKLSS